MSLDTYKLEVFKRASMSKGELNRLRKEGKVPGVYYSHNSKESISFYMEKTELHNIQKSGARLLQISVGGKLVTVFFKAVQFHPVTDEVLHIDLYGVKMDEKMQIAVPIQLVGTPIGVHDEGGKMTQPLLSLEIECLPSDIPDFIEVDVSGLHISDSLHAGAVELPENISLVTSPESVIASVTHAMTEVEPAETEEEEEDLSFEEGDITSESEEQE